MISLVTVFWMQVAMFAIYAVSMIMSGVVIYRSNKRAIKDQEEHEKRMTSFDMHANTAFVGTGARVYSLGCPRCVKSIARARSLGVSLVVPCPECGAK